MSIGCIYVELHHVANIKRREAPRIISFIMCYNSDVDVKYSIEAAERHLRLAAG